MDISHAHLNYVCPFPKNFEELIRGFDTVIVPEINNGQLVRLIRDKFLIPAKPINKIKGRPFGVQELKDAIKGITSGNPVGAES
jgi:2-oxoglutarate ferredoxin oxidoreductase subunit alpha